MKKLFAYFTKGELMLWLSSALIILLAYFALCYALNDIVLIVLWILAAMKDISYLSVIICFSVFLVNDLYGFFNWRKMEKHQNRNK